MSKDDGVPRLRATRIPGSAFALTTHLSREAFETQFFCCGQPCERGGIQHAYLLAAYLGTPRFIEGVELTTQAKAFRKHVEEMAVKEFERLTGEPRTKMTVKHDYDANGPDGPECYSRGSLPERWEVQRFEPR